MVDSGGIERLSSCAPEYEYAAAKIHTQILVYAPAMTPRQVSDHSEDQCILLSSKIA